MTLQIGVIGCGGITRAHIEGWKQSASRAKVVAFADVSEAAMAQRQAQLGYDVTFYSDYHKLLASGEVDAVDICLPHHLHKEAIVATAQAGKHLMTEKPLCLNLGEAAEIEAAVRASGITMMASHNQLFFPAVQQAKKMILKGSLGKIYMVHSYDCSARDPALNPDKSKWGEVPAVFKDAWRTDPAKMGGGELIDTGYHPTYRLLFLAGETPKEVTSMLGTYRLPLKEEDTSEVLVKFEDGMIGHIFTSWAVRAPGARPILFSVMGEFGQLWGERNALYYQPVGFNEPAVVEYPPQSGAGTIAAEIDHFVDAIVNGYEPLHSVAEATDTLRIILAAYESVDGSRTVRI
ncbi:MAG: Gfo/Idh/MocA family oxidoreductase [Chloroflexota bacterium]